MRRLAVLLPALLALLVGASPAHAWTWPVDGPVLQAFSLGGDPYAAGHHRGIDIAAPFGASVAAPAAGSISFAGIVPGGGKTVTIKTSDGYAVTLVHLGTIATRRGVSVNEGGVVGTVGPSGEAEHAKPYVHLGIRVASEPEGYVDPLTLLPVREVVPPPEPPTATPGETEAQRGEPTGQAPGKEPSEEPLPADAPTPAEAKPVAPAKLSVRKPADRPLVEPPRPPVRSRPDATRTRQHAPATASRPARPAGADARRPHVRVDPTSVSETRGAGDRADADDTSSAFRSAVGTLVALAVALGAVVIRRRTRGAALPVPAREPTQSPVDAHELPPSVACGSARPLGRLRTTARVRRSDRHGSVRRSAAPLSPGRRR